MLLIKNEKTRRLLRVVIPFFAVPAVVFLGSTAIAAGLYALVSLLVACLSFVLFLAGFERRNIGTRRMVLAALLTALSCAGRLIPFFKPVTALAIIAGMYLGGETGFLVGALSALISNAYFGQGPWTPFQMLAWGLIGLFAGLLSQYLKKSRPLLMLYGIIAGAAFSLIMDAWTVLWYNNTLRAELYLSAVAAALPFTLLYAASNSVFLRLLAKPFGEKLERIKVKYGV